MARLLIDGVAPVSGTFLARRIRQLDAELEPVVTPLDSLRGRAASCDGVLLAPQLADRLESVRTLVAPVPVGVLPETAFRTGGAEEAVMQARELLRAPSYRGIPTAEPKE